MKVGIIVRHYEKVSSTNSIASALVRKSSPPEGTVITASWQESGRGQPGRSWESEPGKNLLMSLILYPVMVSPASQFIISRAVSLAVCDVVARHTPEVKIKWPNDIYVNDDKIAGILIENSIMGMTLSESIAGIGLNVNQSRFYGSAPNPVSLSLLTGMEHDLAEITGQLFTALERRYAMVTGGETSLLQREYHQRLYRAGLWHHYSDNEGVFEGMITGVMGDGMLEVQRGDGTSRLYAFREIKYII